MGDLVHCKCVLKKSVDPTRPDLLFLVVPPDFAPRIIRCSPVGGPAKSVGTPEWRYEEKDNRLDLTPSLLATDTGFHTDFNWSCEFVLCPEGLGSYDHFYAVNPDLKQRLAADAEQIAKPQMNTDFHGWN